MWKKYSCEANEVIYFYSSSRLVDTYNFRIIHESGYNEQERLQYKPVVYSNMLQSIMAIVKAMPMLKLNFEDSEREADVKIVAEHLELVEEGRFPNELATAMRRLWRDAGVQECLGRSREYQLNDSAE